jgi:mannitol-specific phosphotransferase system IIBC component
MSFFPRPSSPGAALRDLAAFMRQRSREQVIGACLALLVTAIIVIEFLVDSKMDTAPDPQVVEVQLYSPKRTDAQIVADQKRDQEQYKQLAKQLHID